MEWTTLPSVDWWALFRGALLSFSCVIVAFVVVCVFLHLAGRSEGLKTDLVEIAENRRARGDIGREAFEKVHRPPGGTSSPDRAGW